MKFEEAIEEYISQGLRVYYTDERNMNELGYLLFGMEIKDIKFLRIFDVVIFPDKTIHEIPRTLALNGGIDTTQSFKKGEFKNQSIYLEGFKKLDD